MKLSVAVVVLFVAQCPARGFYRRPNSPPPSPLDIFENLPYHVDAKNDYMAGFLDGLSQSPADVWAWFVNKLKFPKKPKGDSGKPNRPLYIDPRLKSAYQGQGDYSDWGVFPNRSHPNYPPPCWPLDTRPQCVGYGR